MIGTVTLWLVTAFGTDAQAVALANLANVEAAGVRNSAVVEEARVRVAEMEALLEAAVRSNPAQLIASHVDTPQAGLSGGTIDQSFTTVGGAYSFTDSVQRGPAVAQARAAAIVAHVDLNEVERAERVTAIGRYFDALRAQAETGARRSLVAGAERDLDAARIRFRAGDAPRLDIVRAQVDLTRASATLDAATVAAANAIDALASETGIDPAALQLPATLDVEPLPNGDEATLVARALASRSDLISARSSVAFERTSVEVAQKSGAPNVTLSAGYTQGIDSGAHVGGPTAQLQVGLPIGGPLRSRVDAQLDRVKEAELRVAALEREVRLDVITALRSTLAATRAVRTASASQQAAHDELAAVQAGYRAGASSSLDVADARRIDAQAAIDALDARYNEARTRAVLVEAIGS